MKKELFLKNKFINKTISRPKVILKFAQSLDGYIGSQDKQIWLTNGFSKRLVHKWRAECDAILVGTRTAEIDNPELSTRFGFGVSPVRLVIDKNLRLNKNLKIFSGEQKTIVFSEVKTNDKQLNTNYLHIKKISIVSILEQLAQLKIKSVIIEGGASTLIGFIDSGLWDEARVFTSPNRLLEGIKAPKIPAQVKEKYVLDSDVLEIFVNDHPTG